ncbi:MAG: DUF485 domain-containing protein [Planctomycetota bacterium]|nr:DUF485 domain-containing protein [Planctomycetota bacterium]
MLMPLHPDPKPSDVAASAPPDPEHRDQATSHGHVSLNVGTVSPAQFRQIAEHPEFQALVARKKRFIWPAIAFFVVYYFLLPALVGYFPKVMETRLVGQINVAYVFALSQFFMAWVVMALYVVKARSFDKMEHEFVRKVKEGRL